LRHSRKRDKIYKIEDGAGAVAAAPCAGALCHEQVARKVLNAVRADTETRTAFAFTR